MSRSENMRRIRGRDTKPEIEVRRMLRELGFPGYRLHIGGLPGKPDIAFLRRKQVIFVHGCFWHGHDCKAGSREPTSNRDYWLPKLARTRARDTTHSRELAQMGWAVLTIWECELRDKAQLADKIVTFLRQNSDSPRVFANASGERTKTFSRPEAHQ